VYVAVLLPVGRDAFMIGAASSLVLAIAWALVISMPYGWHSQDSLVWDLEFSLYAFGASRNLHALEEHQNHNVTKLSQIFDTLEKRDEMLWINAAREKFCMDGVFPEWCDYFHTLQLASWIVLGSVSFGICCLLMGVNAGFVFHYLKSRLSRSYLRQLAFLYFVIALVMFQLGFWVYYFMTRSTGGHLMHSGIAFGWMFYMAAALNCVSWIPPWMLLACAFRFSWDQEDDTTDDEEEGFWLGIDAKATYGVLADPFGSSPEYEATMRRYASIKEGDSETW
jgi:hypothetical protein